MGSKSGNERGARNYKAGKKQVRGNLHAPGGKGGGPPMLQWQKVSNKRGSRPRREVLQT